MSLDRPSEIESEIDKSLSLQMKSQVKKDISCIFISYFLTTGKKFIKKHTNTHILDHFNTTLRLIKCFH
jgi:hypothetical protein